MKKVNSQTTPIYRNSGFLFAVPEDMGRAFATPALERTDDQWLYSRYSNPTVVSAESVIAGLEGAEYTLLTPSGMSAIDVTLSIFQKGVKTGRWMFFSEIYGGTNTYIDRILVARRGIDIIRLAPGTDGMYPPEMVEKALVEQKPDILYFETVTNPMLTVCDAREIIRIARRLGIRTIVDNTFATPYLWKPLADGADIVLHSATKYLSGHGDLTAGCLSTNDKELYMAALEYRQYSGFIISPDDASRLESYLQTFDCRMNCHNVNAERLARFLTRNESKVEKVMYPGLENDVSHRNAKSLFGDKGYGGMLTLVLRGQTNSQRAEISRKFAKHLVGRINIIATLGNAQTIMLPINEAWSDRYSQPGIFRLSVGLEPYEKIETTVKEALETI